LPKKARSNGLEELAMDMIDELLSAFLILGTDHLVTLIALAAIGVAGLSVHVVYSVVKERDR